MTARRPTWAPAPPHPDVAQVAIAAELVRVSLAGAPHRPELVYVPPDPRPRRRPT